MPPKAAITAAFVLAIGVFASYMSLFFVPLTPNAVLLLEATMLVSLLACPFALSTGVWLLVKRRTLPGILLLALSLPLTLVASVAFAMLLSE